MHNFEISTVRGEELFQCLEGLADEREGDSEIRKFCTLSR